MVAEPSIAQAQLVACWRRSDGLEFEEASMASHIKTKDAVRSDRCYRVHAPSDRQQLIVNSEQAFFAVFLLVLLLGRDFVPFGDMRVRPHISVDRCSTRRLGTCVTIRNRNHKRLVFKGDVSPLFHDEIDFCHSPPRNRSRMQRKKSHPLLNAFWCLFR